MSKTKANTISEVVSWEDMQFMNREHPVKFGWKHAYIAYYEPKKGNRLYYLHQGHFISYTPDRTRLRLFREVWRWNVRVFLQRD